MTEYKILLGALATVIALGSYVPYIRDIVRGRTKPHAFSWFVWALLTGIGFVAQVVEGGGAGAWVTGVSAVVDVVIVVLALKKGQKNFHAFDWIALAGALLALALWRATRDPTGSVILISISDAVGFLPTFRTGYARPNEETALLFVLSAVKYVIGIVALEHFSIATWFYPASLVVMNGLFVSMLFARRRTRRG